ncbi:unnamed protein product [Calicophoron daubneyi]|uniref:Uncharacterized protein n=1 Tax=Calicophoron daubneyi TaxID=300641 RepID=A0AAV2T4H7_CALDB
MFSAIRACWIFHPCRVPEAADYESIPKRRFYHRSRDRCTKKRMMKLIGDEDYGQCEKLLYEHKAGIPSLKRSASANEDRTASKRESKTPLYILSESDQRLLRKITSEQSVERAATSHSLRLPLSNDSTFIGTYFAFPPTTRADARMGRKSSSKSKSEYSEKVLLPQHVAERRVNA